MDNGFYIGLLFEAAKRAGRAGDGPRATKLIIDALKSAPGAGTNEAEYIAPFGQLPEDIGSDDLLEAGIPALLAASDSWREQGGGISQRLSLLEELPEPLRRRVIAEHLRRGIPEEIAAVEDFLVSHMKVHRAFPEGLALIRKSVDENVELDLVAIVLALGDPPSPVEVANWPESQPFPEEWTRPRGWLVAIPEDVSAKWASPTLVLDQRRGVPPSDGRLIGDVAFFSGPTTPFTTEELQAIPPMDAADRIGGWTPDPGNHFGPTPRGLERTLQQVVEQHPRDWAETSLGIVSKLRHPTYIYGYFNGLKTKSSDIVDFSRDLAEVVLVINAEPWPVSQLHPDDFEADPDWHAAREASIDLLGSLAGDNGDFADLWPQVASLTYGAASNTSDSTGVSGDTIDALTAALNRASTRALNAAFSISEHEPRAGDELSPEFLGVIERWLEADADSAIEGRAMIASRLPYLRARSPSWFRKKRDELVGDAAPRGLGPKTFDQYLKWGRPRSELLDELTPSYFKALKTEPRAALQHILHGYLWGLPPFSDASSIVRQVADQDAGAVSISATVLSVLVATANDAALQERALEYWQAALDLDLDSVAYPGFGDFVELDGIPDEVWRGLTLATLGKSKGKLSSAASVAERAGRESAAPTSVEIVLRLLRGEPDLWEANQIAQVAREIVQENGGGEATAAPRKVLRELLLQRGYSGPGGLG